MNEERFARKVASNLPALCWPWLGAKSGRGYGTWWDGARWWKAHRKSFALEGNRLVHGKTIDHLCRNPWCVNHSHMEQVSYLTNNLRGEHRSFKAARTNRCQRGHPLDPSNTYWLKRKDRSATRNCRMCFLMRAKKYYAKRVERKAKKVT